MDILSADLEDVLVISPKRIEDKRGWFMEAFRLGALEEVIGRNLNFCQENQTMSKYGVLRGLHYQLPPYAQSKLVTVLSGKVLDVIVDVREGSPTFREHTSIILSDENRKMIFIPRGFAHGCICLSKKALFSYKVDNYYNKRSEGSIAYDDPNLNIDWGIDEKEIIVSDKDKNHPFSDDAKCFKYKDPLYD